MAQGIKPTREQFETYVAIQKSGVTNMYATKVIYEIALDVFGVELTEENCIYIYDHYSELVDEYLR